MGAALERLQLGLVGSVGVIALWAVVSLLLGAVMVALLVVAPLSAIRTETGGQPGCQALPGFIWILGSVIPAVMTVTQAHRGRLRPWRDAGRTA